MIHFDLPKEKSSIIKVIGIGGGGSNAVNHMYSQNIEGVNFIIANTDAQAIALSNVPNKVQLGPHLTQGLGAGANPEIGRQATEESLEELRSMLEVNTKMAFVTAGMGGGTGTGGAPIIAQICRDLGILTVGIVTTPFAYEGKKRQLQAEEGIQRLKQYVDTLLVISNDKLRHQFGNLKMREAFAKADNVLATAAKCITDVINSTGQINVDFADVCTVMRNGGVAILGNAACNGDNRAQRAIEEALNSPLLNDNDIRGAKWILININSAEGEHEFTMDEVDIIQNYLLTQAGENSDVILGMGYDNTLGDKLSITLIATGFEFHDPFSRLSSSVQAQMPEQPRQPEKIVMTLDTGMPEEKKPEPVAVAPIDPLAPTLVEEDEPVAPTVQPRVVVQSPSVQQPAQVRTVQPAQPVAPKPVQEDTPVHMQLKFKEETPAAPAADPEQLEWEQRKKALDEKFAQLHRTIVAQSNTPLQNQNNNPASAASGGYLARPSNIYADKKGEVSTSRPAEEPVAKPVAKIEEEENFPMQLVIRNNIPAADEPRAHQTPPPQPPKAEDPAMQDVAEEQKRRAAERLQKLRNLSFNVNAADPNNEFETVPAYIRRNMELSPNTASVENFYSNYSVKPDSTGNSQISTINSFLDGKKPD
ncbi:cell division protein FtsZ [Paracnuella aquatica]|uniref:cell division protein FtsZ n=1 Tax=Paracnuella aquatica TaxID=2268757 RepID=UPI000DEF8644|nr:cell division protein FtsZ [Paracnuella aquatica]RPD47557.1 cell division protein FtsZ [Paracnuella aquatica]